MLHSMKKISKKTALIWAMLLVGLGALEFPGVLFFGHKVYPLVFGVPFLYAYVICWWIYLCAVLFYAYKTEWGKRKFLKQSGHIYSKKM